MMHPLPHPPPLPPRRLLQDYSRAAAAKQADAEARAEALVDCVRALMYLWSAQPLLAAAAAEAGLLDAVADAVEAGARPGSAAAGCCVPFTVLCAAAGGARRVRWLQA
jgi:hypothetical protein